MKAIIPAAGYGTRMLPVTKTVPKEMLPIGNKPVIQYIVEGFVGAGISEIIIITSQGKQTLEDYFDKNYELEEILKKKGKLSYLDEINKPKEMAKYIFIKQSQQFGFPHAVAEAKSCINEEYFFVSVGDQFGDPRIYQEMIKLHNKEKQPIICLQEVDYDDVEKYGIAEIKNGKITDLIEKPKKEQAPSNLACNGLYILPFDFFNAVDGTELNKDKGEIVMPDCLLALKEKYSLIPYINTYKFRDVGTTSSWLQANNETFNLGLWK